jgi:Uma2 family endonuclease
MASFTPMIVRPDAPPLTVEDYRSLPETGPRYQLIEGDLYMAPAPNRFHQEISRNLQMKLFLHLRETGAGKIFNAPLDVYLDETNVFQPDLIVVLNDRMGILTEEGAEGAPNLVIEILSPKTRRSVWSKNAKLILVLVFRNFGSLTPTRG